MGNNLSLKAKKEIEAIRAWEYWKSDIHFYCAFGMTYEEAIDRLCKDMDMCYWEKELLVEHKEMISEIDRKEAMKIVNGEW